MRGVKSFAKIALLLPLFHQQDHGRINSFKIGLLYQKRHGITDILVVVNLSINKWTLAQHFTHG